MSGKLWRRNERFPPDLIAYAQTAAEPRPNVFQHRVPPTKLELRNRAKASNPMASAGNGSAHVLA
jgi:hypothetical protein